MKAYQNFFGKHTIMANEILQLLHSSNTHTHVLEDELKRERGSFYEQVSKMN